MSRDKSSSFRFKTYDAAHPHRTAGVSDEVWERHEQTITQMHNQKITVTSMLEHLKREHGFEPSFGQLARKLKGWGLRKYRRRGSRSTYDCIDLSPELDVALQADTDLEGESVADEMLNRADDKHDFESSVHPISQPSPTARSTGTDPAATQSNQGNVQVDIMITSLSMSPQSYSSFRDYAQTLSQTLSSELGSETGKHFTLDAGGDTYMLSTPSSWNFERATGLHGHLEGSLPRLRV